MILGLQGVTENVPMKTALSHKLLNHRISMCFEFILSSFLSPAKLAVTESLKVIQIYTVE